MRLTSFRLRCGFTLVEVLVVIAVIGMLVALLLPAIQAAREAGRRSACQNKLRQLGVAVQNFHNGYKFMPPYFGIKPKRYGDTQYPWDNRAAVYGGWFVHLLPFVEENPLHQSIAADCRKVPMNEPVYSASTGQTVQVVIDQNGHTTVYSYDPGQTVLSVNGIWIERVHQVSFPVLQCPSDPTLRPKGLVYDWWGGTSYLANWHAFGTGDDGLWTRARKFSAIKDGLSKTVLFAEGYSTCDNLGRIALYSWWYHNFGLNQDNIPNTLMFQVQPGLGKCDGCCDNWRAQSPHSVMQVALADGSIRSLDGTISSATWSHLLLPRDGQPQGNIGD